MQCCQVRHLNWTNEKTSQMHPIFLFLVFSIFSCANTTTTYICECDLTLAETNAENSCTITFDDFNVDTVNYCTCKDSSYENYWTNTSGTYYASCKKPSVTPDSLLRCNTGELSDTWKSVTKYLILATSVIVIIMTLAALLMNCLNKTNGSFSALRICEEFTYFVLFLVMGILQFFFIEKKNPCKIIAIVTHLAMTFLSGVHFMEAHMAQQIINNKKQMHVAVSMIFPAILAILSAVLTYLFQKDHYGVSLLSCHAVTNVGMMYGFVVPVWILVFLAGLSAQRGLLKCVKIKENSDVNYVYWAHKTAKTIMPLSTLTTSIYILIMFGLDQQRFYVLLMAAFLNVILAFYIYAAHTASNKNLAMKKAPGPGGIYKQCYVMDELDDDEPSTAKLPPDFSDPVNLPPVPQT